VGKNLEEGPLLFAFFSFKKIVENNDFSRFLTCHENGIFS
jgi:hypothetical protein